MSKNNPKIHKYALKDTGLLSPTAVDKLTKTGIKNPEYLYWSIQRETDKISEILEIDTANTLALGSLLLDWIDEETLKFWADLSLKKTGSPIKLDYQQKQNRFLL